jgi:hypothetical protein
MPDLLRRDLLLKGSKVEIENMAFFAKLQQGYDCRVDVYNQSRAFARPHGVALALEVGERDGLGLGINIEGDHWVSAALDFKNSMIYYGDPLNGDPTDKVQSVLNWWTFHHTGQKFAYQKLKVTIQRDGFSCGLLAPNGLAHFYLPNEYLLISAAEVDTERVQILLRVVQRHLYQAEAC